MTVSVLSLAALGLAALTLVIEGVHWQALARWVRGGGQPVLVAVASFVCTAMDE